MTLAKAIRRNTDPDADGKSPLGRTDYVARITLRAGERRLESDAVALVAVSGRKTHRKGRKIADYFSERVSLFP